MTALPGLESPAADGVGHDEWVRRVLGFNPAVAGSALSASAASSLFKTPPPPATGGHGQQPPAGTQPLPPTPEQVRSVQDGLSKWRVAAGGTALNASGKLDQDTKQAIIDFQRQAGLHPQDGVYGPALEKRLAVMLKVLNIRLAGNIPRFSGPDLERFTAGPGFGSMDQRLQDAVLERVGSFASQTSLLDDHSDKLMKLINESGFEQLPDRSQRLLLRVFSKHPADADLTDNLDQLIASSAFRKLDERLREEVLHHLQAYDGDRTKVDNTENLITATTPLERLAPSVQDRFIRASFHRPDDTPFLEQLRRAVEGNLSTVSAGINFESFSEDLQASVIEQIEGLANLDAAQVDGVLALAATPQVAALPAEVRDDVLSVMPSTGLGLALGTGAAAADIADLTSDQAFQDVPGEYRRLMLELLGARPGSTRLVEAFKSLAEMPGFKNDRRNGRKRIFDADASIHD